MEKTIMLFIMVTASR